MSVRASSANPWDWHFIRGEPVLFRAAGLGGVRRPKFSVRLRPWRVRRVHRCTRGQPCAQTVNAGAINALARQTLKPFNAKVTTQALTEIADFIQAGHITPVIDRTYPLTEAAAAIALVERGTPAGKVIVTIRHATG